MENSTKSPTRITLASWLGISVGANEDLSRRKVEASSLNADGKSRKENGLGVATWQWHYYCVVRLRKLGKKRNSKGHQTRRRKIASELHTCL
jgi:hypothetical protein